MTRHAAVDLGASSARVVLGEVDTDRLELEVVHRFANEPLATPTGLHWDITRLREEVVAGLRMATGAVTVGVDTWAIDYGLLDQSSELVEAPFHYRDDRTAGMAEKLQAELPAEQLYSINGLQHLPFTTIYQLVAESQLTGARRLLLMPDLIGYWLSGVEVTELTNASTTGLLDVHSRKWSERVLGAVGLQPSLLAELCLPGQRLGRVLPEVGLAAELVTVGSHDTASAVVGVPMADEDAAYISLGTWGLVGVELEAPIVSEASRVANFTNELGVDGRVRYLRNVMGLWLVQECLRDWGQPDLLLLLAAAAELPRGGPTFDVNDPRLLAPGGMPARIAALLNEAGWPPLTRRLSLIRCIVDSLALALAETVEVAAALSGRNIRVVHVVGGGAQNALLCQLLADLGGRPVLAGPVEATAVGNLLIQARGHGTLDADLDGLRDLIRRTQHVRRFDPRP